MRKYWIFLALLYLALFATFIRWREGHAYNEVSTRIAAQSPRISEPVWEMNPESAKQELLHLVNIENLSSASIHHNDNELFVELVRSSELPSNFDKKLISLGVYRVGTLRTPLIINNETIGYLQARWINKRTVTSLFVGLLLALTFALFAYHLILRNNHALLKVKQKQLNAAHQQFRMVLDSIKSVIYVSDIETHEILFANTHACEIFGEITAGDICYKKFQDDQGCACSFCTNDQLLDSNGKPTGVIVGELKNTKTKRWNECRAVAIPWIDDKLVRLSVGTDIQDRHELESQLRHSEKMSAVGHLAGGVAHDFNNQLAVIKGFADVITSCDLTGYEIQEYAQKILNATKRSAALTKQLLAFARKGDYESEIVDVHAIISEVALFLEHSIGKSISIKQHLEANPHATMGDPSQLQNAMLNIAINARDAMKSGGSLTFRTNCIDVKDSHDIDSDDIIASGTYIQITIEDTGIGISEETRKHIFEPFFTSKPVGEGTGMGLASVYGTVRNHGGCVTCSSTVGEGSIFNIFLPVAQTDILTAEDSEEYSSDTKGIKTLVIDDEETVLDVSLIMLRQMGHDPIGFSDPAEAIAYYQREWKDIQLILLDIIMPKMGGVEVFGRLRKINPNANVLLISGYSLTSDSKALLNEGAKGFIQKPFDIRVISESIKSVMESNTIKEAMNDIKRAVGKPE